MAANSPTSAMYTVHLATSASDDPQPSRIRRMFSSTSRVFVPDVALRDPVGDRIHRPLARDEQEIARAHRG